MLTLCGQCKASLDETKETCADCGAPNPYCDVNYGSRPQGPTDLILGAATNSAGLDRALVLLGGIDFAIAVLLVLGLETDPTVVSTVIVGTSAVLGLASLLIVSHVDLSSANPAGRWLGRIMVVLNGVSLYVLLSL